MARSWLVLVLALLAPTLAAADDAPRGSPDLSGQWMSNFGPVNLQQDGLTIAGSFTEGTQRLRDAYMQGKTISAAQWSANPGTISDGVVDPGRGTLVFHYHEAVSQLDGVATLTLSKDGTQLEGPFVASGMGGHLNGTWTMWRNNCGSAKYLQAC